MLLPLDSPRSTFEKQDRAPIFVDHLKPCAAPRTVQVAPSTRTDDRRLSPRFTNHAGHLFPSTLGKLMRVAHEDGEAWLVEVFGGQVFSGIAKEDQGISEFAFANREQR